jgi:putative ABC transport system ATP-binding protein
VTALQEINICKDNEIGPIKRGEFVMLRGQSGCGKTTLLNILGTIDQLSSGTISRTFLQELLGRSITKESKDAELSRMRLEDIGFVFQTFNLLAALTVKENVELPMRILGRLKEAEIVQRREQLLKKVGLQERMNHLPSELSGGEQQRVYVLLIQSDCPSTSQPSKTIAVGRTYRRPGHQELCGSDEPAIKLEYERL